MTPFFHTPVQVLIDRAKGAEPSLAQIIQDFYIKNGFEDWRAEDAADAYIAALSKCFLTPELEEAIVEATTSAGLRRDTRSSAKGVMSLLRDLIEPAPEPENQPRPDSQIAAIKLQDALASGNSDKIAAAIREIKAAFPQADLPELPSSPVSSDALPIVKEPPPSIVVAFGQYIDLDRLLSISDLRVVGGYFGMWSVLFQVRYQLHDKPQDFSFDVQDYEKAKNKDGAWEPIATEGGSYVTVDRLKPAYDDLVAQWKARKAFTGA